MNDLDTLRANLRQYLTHAPLRDLGELLDRLADELFLRRVPGAPRLYEVAAHAQALATARTTARAAEPIFSADCAPTSK